MKKVQIGARISHEDAEFISQLQIEGARTPSDKLRAIIEQARKEHENAKDFTGVYRSVLQQVLPLIEYIKREELANEKHSELVEKILNWLPEFYAYTLTGIHPEQEQNDLIAYERGLLERTFRLLESILHIELSKNPSSYTPSLVRNHLESVEDLLHILHNLSDKREKES
ncbi:hypothetical protein [Desulfogranum japonicum]|uniref:hypothetical protein n=1 Tax=Desulfogranum japonicum TaxID=231447 RepID=UPI00040A93F9|nr:hypothetical protein [Desulfogranum japonicum]